MIRLLLCSTLWVSSYSYFTMVCMIKCDMQNVVRVFARARDRSAEPFMVAYPKQTSKQLRRSNLSPGIGIKLKIGLSWLSHLYRHMVNLAEIIQFAPD